MAKIRFENGKTVNFEGTPTPEDVDFVAKQLGITSSAQAPQEEKGGFLSDVAKGILKTPARLATNVVNTGQLIAGKPTTQPFSGKFLGEVKPIGTEGTFGQRLKESVGAGVELASYIPVARGVKTGIQLAKEPFKQAIGGATKALAKEGAVQGGLGSLGRSMADNKGFKETAENTALGTLGGGILGGVLGGATSTIARGLTKTPKNILDSRLDDNIRNIFKDTTADVGKINDSAFKAKKALELLQKESGKIKIPDDKAPLGSKLSKSSKPFDLQKSTPNELLSGVMEMDKKIASNARKAVEKAKESGLKIDTTDIQEKILGEIDRGNVPKVTAKRMLAQILDIADDPVKIHDWVQDVNMKYGKKYQRGTIDDTAVGSLADDIAGELRKKLDSVVDRKGYAEAFGNNQELKRMLLAIAKKANKNVNFGDITTDAGLDLGISLLTGNPLYMARTLGSSLFKGVISKVRNTSGIRSFKKAAGIAKKLPTKTKLPSSRVKLPAPLPQPKNKLPKLSKVNKQSGFSKTAVLGAGVLGATPFISSKETYKKEEELSKVGQKKPNTKNISNVLMQLESSGGKDTRSADEGEMKWLTGLTNVAIEELKRVGRLKNIDVNNKEQVLKASADYFNYLAEKNPQLSLAEVYVDKYWNGWKKLPNGREIREKKIKQFNELN